MGAGQLSESLPQDRLAKLQRVQKGNGTPETLRMAWGSNYPASAGTLVGLLELARNTVACLPPRDQEQLFGGTALNLYPDPKS